MHFILGNGIVFRQGDKAAFVERSLIEAGEYIVSWHYGPKIARLAEGSYGSLKRDFDGMGLDPSEVYEAIVSQL